MCRSQSPLPGCARADLPRRRTPRDPSGAGMTAAGAAHRHAWLELIQISGPFLTVPIADQTWPSGLPAVDRDTRAQLRAAVAEVLATGGTTRAKLARLVLAEALDWREALQEGPQ